MAPHSSILAWKIPWKQKSGRLQSMVSQKSWIQLSNSTVATIVILIWKMRMFGQVCDSSGLSSYDINAPSLFLYSSQPVFPFWKHIIFKNFSCLLVGTWLIVLIWVSLITGGVDNFYTLIGFLYIICELSVHILSILFYGFFIISYYVTRVT